MHGLIRAKLGGSPAMLAATGCFLLATNAYFIAAPLALIGCLALWLSIAHPESANSRAQAFSVGAVLTSLLLVVGWRTRLIELPSFDAVSYVIWMSLGIALILLQIAAIRWAGPGVGIAIVIVSVACVSILGTRVLTDPDSLSGYSDVVLMHRSATQAVLAGVNPYEFAQIADLDPTVYGASVIHGYPYPPMTLAPLVVSEWALGEPRWLLLGSWLTMLTVLGVKALRSQTMLPAVAMLAVFPMFRVTLLTGWTETLTLGLASMALLSLTNRRIGPVVAVAATVASKQYFALLIPLSLAMKHPRRRPLALAVVALLLATFLPYILLGPDHLIQALYRNIAGIAGTNENFSLIGTASALGFSLEIHRAIWFIVVVCSGLVLGRFLRTWSHLIIGSVIVLAIAFMTTAAYANYWLLCAGLTAIGGVAADIESRELVRE